MQQFEFAKTSLFNIDYAIVDYDLAAKTIVQMAALRRSFGVSALAVHGLVTAVKDCRVGDAVRSIDMVVPDGQPVRWALNIFHQAGLQDRVYGPTLTLHVLKMANEMGLSVFLYGSTKQTLDLLTKFIQENYPSLRLAGTHVDRFRDATRDEDREDILKINQSGAQIVLVGRGCPRQEIWVADHLGKVNAAMMAVGAAFDFHAGTLRQAPHWMQKCGLEWFFRLLMEPRRLWKRYLMTNSYFIWLCFRELFNGFFGRKSRNQYR